jgi:predicted nucleotidyltransferase
MTDGLKEKHRHEIIRIVSSNERVERAILFGSRANGAYRPTSDIDLVLLGNDLTLRDQAHLLEEIEETTIPQRVDLVLYRSIENIKLFEEIDQNGIEWYRRSTN